MAAVYSYTSYFFTEPAMGAPVCLSVTLFSPLREWPAHPTPWVGVATVLKMKVFLLIGCCLPKIHIHSIC
jgi:hypothetical protein